MAEPADDAERDRAVRRYGRLEDQFAAMGGYAAETTPPASAPTSACPTACWRSRCARSPVASAAGSSSPASCSPTPTRLLLDEPTNHLDADSIVWLQVSHKSGLVVISHDVELLEAVVNKVWHLDANRATVDVYNLGWKRYLDARETDERRRRPSGPTPRRRSTR